MDGTVASAAWCSTAIHLMRGVLSYHIVSTTYSNNFTYARHFSAQLHEPSWTVYFEPLHSLGRFFFVLMVILCGWNIFHSLAYYTVVPVKLPVLRFCFSCAAGTLKRITRWSSARTTVGSLINFCSVQCTLAWWWWWWWGRGEHASPFR